MLFCKKNCHPNWPWICSWLANSNRMNHHGTIAPITNGWVTLANTTQHSLQVPTVLPTTRNISVFFYGPKYILHQQLPDVSCNNLKVSFTIVVYVYRSPIETFTSDNAYHGLLLFFFKPYSKQRTHRDFGITSPPLFPRPSNWPLRLNAARFLSRRWVPLLWRPIPWSHGLPVVWGTSSSGRWPCLRRNAVLQVESPAAVSGALFCLQVHWWAETDGIRLLAQGMFWSET